VYETEKEYHIDCDVPGFKKEEVKVECDEDFLIIKAEHFEHSEHKSSKQDAKWHISERSQSWQKSSQKELKRKIRLPRYFFINT
jgi:HSP20 family molecular chaperone IbpA